MKNINVHEPDGWRTGNENREMMRQAALRAKLIYQGIVAKRTGALAASAVDSVQNSSYYGGFVGKLTVGTNIGYEAAHELRPQKAYGGKAPKDLDTVLSMLARGW